jgi:hypothetical protein
MSSSGWRASVTHQTWRASFWIVDLGFARASVVSKRVETHAAPPWPQRGPNAYGTRGLLIRNNWLSFLVFLDRSFDLFSVRPVIGPSDRQVGLGQVRVVFSDLRIRQPQPAPRNDTRDRVPRISNARLATTHV